MHNTYYFVFVRINRNIKRRILSFHSKAKRIAEDFSRKVSKRIINEAIRMNSNVIKLENLKYMIKKVKKLHKKFRNKLYLMQYRRIQYWIDWQAKKHGLLVKYISAYYSSIKCRKCNNQINGKYMNIEGKYLYVEEKGKDFPVILVHLAGFDSRIYYDTFEHFSEKIFFSALMLTIWVHLFVIAIFLYI